MAKEGLGCLWLHVRCCLVGVFHSVKPTANVFSFEEKADLAGKGFVCPCLWLRGHCCLAGGLRSLKPTPNVFSFVEKADLA